MCVDELVWVGQEEIFVQLVVELLCGRLFADDAPGGPVSVNEAPGAVDIHSVPRVLVLARDKLHAWSVVSTFSIAANDLGVQASIAKHTQSMTKSK